MPNLKHFDSIEDYRAWYRNYQKSSKIIKYKRKYIKKWRLKNSLNKDIIRQKVRRALKLGLLKKEPCEVCGELKVEAHHPDYRSPLRVNWLCRIHHRERDVLEGKRKS